MKVDLSMRLRYLCLTLALLTSSIICFNIIFIDTTWIRQQQCHPFSIVWELLHYDLPNADVLHQCQFLTSTLERQWLPMRIFLCFYVVFIKSVNKIIDTCKHKRTLTNLYYLYLRCNALYALTLKSCSFNNK